MLSFLMRSVTAAELEAAMNAEESELDTSALDNVAGGLNLAVAPDLILGCSGIIPRLPRKPKFF